MESAASRWHLSSLCFAFLVGRCRVTRKAKSTPLTRYSYHERDYAFGRAMPKLRTSVDLGPAALAALLRGSSPAVPLASGREASTIPNLSICNTFLGCECKPPSLCPGGMRAWREGQFFIRRKRWEGRCHLMHADFSRPSEYTHSGWMQPTSGAGSLDRYKTLNSLRPHLFLEAGLLTQAGVCGQPRREPAPHRRWEPAEHTPPHRGSQERGPRRAEARAAS